MNDVLFFTESKLNCKTWPKVCYFLSGMVAIEFIADYVNCIIE